MNQMNDIEDLVKLFGEQNRKVVVDAIEFLEEREAKWGLDEKINRIEYLEDILARKK